MARRLTRKEIKHDIREDEFRVTLFRVLEWIETHRRAMVAGLIGVVFLVAAGFAFAGYLEGRREAAAERLARAMEVYEAPVVEEGARPDDPDDPTFPSEEARRQRARELFEAVEGFGAGAAADVARLYLADVAVAEGEAGEARRIWEDFLAGHQDHVLAVSVRVNLLHLDRQEGKAEEVAERLQQELEREEKSLPEDVLLVELARTLEKLGRTEEAEAHLQRIVDEYPQSPYAAEARRKTQE